MVSVLVNVHSCVNAVFDFPYSTHRNCKWKTTPFFPSMKITRMHFVFVHVSGEPSLNERNTWCDHVGTRCCSSIKNSCIHTHQSVHTVHAQMMDYLQSFRSEMSREVKRCTCAQTYNVSVRNVNSMHIMHYQCVHAWLFPPLTGYVLHPVCAQDISTMTKQIGLKLGGRLRCGLRYSIIHFCLSIQN